jgi:hypothetical protein
MDEQSKKYVYGLSAVIVFLVIYIIYTYKPTQSPSISSPTSSPTSTSTSMNSGLLVHLDAANPKSYPGNGKIWFDLSGNSNHFNMIGTLNYSNGVFTTIPGSNVNYFTGPSPFKYSRVEETIEFWCKNSTNSANDALWSYAVPQIDYPNTTNMLIPVSDNHDLLYDSRNLSIYVNQIAVPTNENIATGRWTQVVRTSNRITGEEKLYIDGVLKFTTTILPGIIYRQGGTFMIGQEIDLLPAPTPVPAPAPMFLDPNQVLNGSYSIFKLYNRVLSPSEISQNYKNIASRYGK